MSEKRGNYNNMTFRAESFKSGSHITIIIQTFTLVSFISTITPHPVKLLLETANLSHLMYSTLYALDSLSFYIPAGKTFCLYIYLRLTTYQGM